MTYSKLKIEITIEAKSIKHFQTGKSPPKKNPRLNLPALFQFFYFLHIQTFFADAFHFSAPPSYPSHSPLVKARRVLARWGTVLWV